VRGGGRLPAEISDPARQEVAELAGHARKRASNAYCGVPTRTRKQDSALSSEE
jgi:hypothetical protein